MYEDDPQDRVFDLLGEAVFGAHPLGRPVIGTAEVIGAATREQLSAFHATRYVPRGIVIAAAGSVDHDALVAMAKAAERSPAPAARAQEASLDGAGEANAPARTRSLRSAPRRPAPEFKRRVRFLEKETEQYHVCIGGAGIARDDERRFALRVLEGVLGGTSSSGSSRRCASAAGLAYSVFCFSNLYAHTGEVGLYVGTRPENLAEALAVVARELERCVEDPATEEELIRSRENLKGRVVLALESTAARMSRLGASVLHGLPILSIDEVIERIDAVGVDELGELARRAVRRRAAVGRRRRARRGALPRGDRAARCRRRDLTRTRSRHATAGRSMIRVAVAGAAGRMGADRLRGRRGRRRHGARRPRRPAAWDDARRGPPEAEVVVDFTRPDTALGNALACLRAGVHVVIGTTGFDPAPLRAGGADAGASAGERPIVRRTSRSARC